MNYLMPFCMINEAIDRHTVLKGTGRKEELVPFISLTLLLLLTMTISVVLATEPDQ